MHLTADSSRLIRQAAGVAREFGHSYVGSEHLLTALCCETGWIGQLLGSVGFDGQTAKYAIFCTAGKGVRDMPLPQGLTKEAKRILRDAGQEARRLGSQGIGRCHIFLSLLRTEHTGAQALLDITAVDRGAVFTRAIEYMHWEAMGPEKTKKELLT